MINKRIVLLFLLASATVCTAQDCYQESRVKTARLNMSSGNDGLMCANAAQFYQMLCACETKPRTSEQAKMLKKTLVKMKSTYNDYGAYCKGIGKINDAIPNCKVGSLNEDGSDKNVNLSNTLLFDDSQLSQLEAMAKQSGDEDFVYLVNDMKRMRETNKMVNLFSRDENSVLRENSMQIVNLFISPFNKKLEEEAKKEEEYAKKIGRLTKDISRLNIQLKTEIFNEYLFKRRTRYLMHLYTNTKKPKENLLELYKSFPINKSYQKVAELIALERKLSKVVMGQNSTMNLLMGKNYQNQLYTIEKSKFSKTLEQIIGKCNVLKKSDIILQLKNSSLPNKNELIISQLGQPSWNEKLKAFKYGYGNADNNQSINQFECNDPTAFNTAIFSLEKKFVPKLESLINSHLKDPMLIYSDVSPKDNELNGIDKSQLKKLYRKKAFNENILRDAWNTLIKTSLNKRKNLNEGVIKDYVAFNSRLEKILNVNLKGLTVKSIDKLFKKEIDFFTEKKLTPNAVLHFIKIANDISYNALDAYLKLNKEKEAREVYNTIIYLTQITIQPNNMNRIAMKPGLDQIVKTKKYLNVYNGSYFSPIVRTGASPLSQMDVLVQGRYLYYRDVFEKNKNIKHTKPGLSFILSDLDKNNFNISKHKEFYSGLLE